MKSFFDYLSRLFHPLFLPFYFLALLLLWFPNAFGLSCYHKGFLFLFQTFSILVLLPMLGIFLIDRLNLIGSLEMQSGKERVIPLIIVLTLSIWYYLNIKGEIVMYAVYLQFILAMVISTGISLFATIFYKISLHATAWTILIAFIGKVNFTTKLTYRFEAHCLGWDNDMVSVISIACLILTILVIFGRLYLKAHTKMEVIYGVLIGATSFVLSNLILN